MLVNNNFSLTDTLEVLSNLTVLFIFIFSVTPVFETQFNLIKILIHYISRCGVDQSCSSCFSS